MAGTWEARKDDLLEAIRLLDLVPSQPGVPSSDFFLTRPNGDGIRLDVASGALAVVLLKGTGEWPYKEPFYISRTMLTPFVTVAKEIKNKALFEFSDTGRLSCRHGTRGIQLSTQAEITGYTPLPKLKNPNNLNLSPEVISLMECAATCAASELQSPQQACVYMAPAKYGVRLLATNQKVVFLARARLDIPIKEPIPFPLTMMPVLRADGLKSLHWEERCVMARFPTGVVWQPFQELARKEFPVEQIVDMIARAKDEDDNLFTVSAYKFARMVERMCLYLGSVRKEDWALTLLSKKGREEMLVAARLPHGNFKEKIGLMEPASRNFQIDLPLDMLAPVFQFVGKLEEMRPLVVGLDKRGASAYLACGPIRMVVPAQKG